MIEMTLRRKLFLGKCTLGELTFKGLVPVWYVLEDTHRDADFDGVVDNKVYGETCIPSGTYSVRWQWSSHFKQMMPYLQDVPGFSGVMIHTGNKVEHTKGCLLVGKKPFKIDDNLYEVHSSAIAFNEISALLKDKKGVYADAVIHIIDEKTFEPNPVQNPSKHERAE